MKKYIALLLLVSLSTAQAMPLSTALTLCKTYGSAALQLAKTVANSTPFNVALIAGTFVSAYASTKQQQAQEEYHALEVAKALAHKNALDAVLHNITNTSPGNTPIHPANLVQDIKAQVDALEAILTKAKQAELARLEKQRSEFNKLFSKILFGVSALSLAQQLSAII